MRHYSRNFTRIRSFDSSLHSQLMTAYWFACDWVWIFGSSSPNLEHRIARLRKRTTTWCPQQGRGQPRQPWVYQKSQHNQRWQQNPLQKGVVGSVVLFQSVAIHKPWPQARHRRKTRICIFSEVRLMGLTVAVAFLNHWRQCPKRTLNSVTWEVLISPHTFVPCQTLFWSKLSYQFVNK